MSDSKPESVEELAAQELRRFEAACKATASGDNEDLRGAMLIVADETGVQSVPYVEADSDPRQMSLWMLGAMMAHISDSARDLTPLEAAEHAAEMLNEVEPDERGDA